MQERRVSVSRKEFPRDENVEDCHCGRKRHLIPKGSRERPFVDKRVLLDLVHTEGDTFGGSLGRETGRVRSVTGL